MVVASNISRLNNVSYKNVFSTQQKEVNAAFLKSLQHYARQEDENGKTLEAEFQQAMALYNGQLEKGENPLLDNIQVENGKTIDGQLNEETLKMLHTIIQLRRKAGEIATHNHKEQADETNENPAVGTANALFKHLKTAGVPYERALELIKEVSNHPVLTAHPTSVTNRDRVKAHRDHSNNILALAKNAAPEEIEQVMLEYMKSLGSAPISKEKQDVYDEVNTALYHAENYWNATPTIYAAFENAAKLNYPDEYQPGDIELDLKMSSWVMGDKDGNLLINESNTLEALQMHDAFARKKCLQAIEAIAKVLPEDTLIIKALKDVALQEPSTHRRKVDFLDTAGIQKVLDHMLNSQDYAAAKPEILNFQRQLTCMGTTMGKLEYRENSSLLMDALDYVLIRADQDYNPEMDADQKEAYFTELLQGNTDIDLAKIIGQELDTIDVNDENISEQAKAFQITFGRFETALLNPEMVENHVIAEAQENHHVLGVELIKQATAEKLRKEGFSDVTPYSMRTTPLYESSEDLDALPDRMEKLLSNDTYCNVLEQQKQHFGFKQIYQAFKVAMSDTTRRAGLPAARIAIQKCCKFTRQVMEAMGVACGIDMGGSYTDALRDGCRPQSEKAALLDIIDLKGTVQGIDAEHTINGPATGGVTESNIVGMTMQNYRHHLEELLQESVPPHTEFMREELARQELKADLEDEIDELLYSVQQECVQEYQQEFYNNPQTDALISALDANDIAEAGTKGSRAKSRKGTITIDGTRTITFSETFKHNGLEPGYLTSTVLQNAIKNRIAEYLDPDSEYKDTKLAKCLKVIQAENIDSDKNSRFDTIDVINAKAMNFMFNRSHLMRDLVNRVGYSTCAANNFETAWQSMFNEPIPDDEQLQAMARNNHASVKNQAAWMVVEQKAGCQFAYAAQMGEPIVDKNTALTHQLGKAKMIEDCYPHFGRYQQTLTEISPRIIEARKLIANKLTVLREAGETESDEYKKLQAHATMIHAVMDGAVFSIPDSSKTAAAYMQAVEKFEKLQISRDKGQAFGVHIMHQAGLMNKDGSMPIASNDNEQLLIAANGGGYRE